MTTVICGVGPALDRLRAEFPEHEIVDLRQMEGPAPEGSVLLAGYDERSVEVARSGVAWVQLPGTGIDHYHPDLLSLPLVTCARGASAVPIAEYVFACLLAHGRRFPETWLTEAPRHWNFQSTACLAGQTLGLVGFGGIGQRVATLALAFDMEVVAVRRTNRPSEVAGVSMVNSVTEMIGSLDHLVLCAPSTPATFHLVDDDLLADSRPGLHLVNVARGALVDQDALRRALDDGRVGRASLDVCDPEPLPDGHWLYGHEKVFLTPHSSWTGQGFLTGTIDLFCANLRRYEAGEELVGLINLDEQY